MDTSHVLAFVMAGGEGTRLHPLTAHCPKPALPLAGDCRLIDFALSNLYNSHIRSIYVLAQYCPQPLLQHLASAWSSEPSLHGGIVKPIHPPAGDHGAAYRGTADAVSKNLHLLDQMKPDVVAIFAADHVYRMDVRQMLAFHRERNADVTVAAIPVPCDRGNRFGIISVDGDGRIERFDEKPALANPMPGHADRALASMGNYLFKPEVLRRSLRRAAQRGEHDFGHHVLPDLLKQQSRMVAYDFHENRTPGLQPHEEAGYWRDVGTLQAFSDAQLDVTGPMPRFELRNCAWPIHPMARPVAQTRAHGQRMSHPQKDAVIHHTTGTPTRAASAA